MTRPRPSPTKRTMRGPACVTPRSRAVLAQRSSTRSSFPPTWLVIRTAISDYPNKHSLIPYSSHATASRRSPAHVSIVSCPPHAQLASGGRHAGSAAACESSRDGDRNDRDQDHERHDDVHLREQDAVADLAEDPDGQTALGAGSEGGHDDLVE